MATKSGGKTIFANSRQIPVGQKFCRNRIFAFNAEIEDGRQKWRETTV